MQVVVACGKATTSLKHTPPPHVFLEEYVNTDRFLAECDIVCCHGGNGTLYQALAYGVPIIAVATHAEQYIGAKRIEQLGLGRALKLQEVRSKGIAILTQAVAHVLECTGNRERAREFAQLLSYWQGAKTAAGIIENFKENKF
jgi:UDP:flavonoid glycosyltransferase YjiC (YdhE family)